MLPDNIRTQTAVVEKLIDQQHDIDKRLTRAETLDKGRPAMETQLNDITGRLGDDRRNHSRGVRRQPPGRTIDTLGRRPHEAKPGRTWDIAAGQLDQHQTAYGLSRGLGSTKGPKLPLGFLFSRGITQEAARTMSKPSATSHSSPKESKDHHAESDDKATRPHPTEQGRTNDAQPHGVKGRLRDSAAFLVLASALRADPLTPGLAATVVAARFHWSAATVDDSVSATGSTSGLPLL